MQKCLGLLTILDYSLELESHINGVDDIIKKEHSKVGNYFALDNDKLNKYVITAS
jgi:hypothetical protein